MFGAIMEEIVHIIPLSFEIDRALKPLEKLKANRVYLIYSNESLNSKKAQAARHFLRVVKDKLEQMDIDVVVQEGSSSDPLPLLSTISNIIVREKKEKNIIYVNMSASGKLTAVAATLAAMYHDVKVYYVPVDGGFSRTTKDMAEHGFSIVNAPNYTVLTNFTIDMPSGAKSAFLSELYKKGEMSTGDIFRMIKDGKLKGFEDLNEGKQRTASNMLVRINRGILDELERNGYVKVERKGRNKVIAITDKGKYAACLIGQSG
jgi:hypothetical protein